MNNQQAYLAARMQSGASWFFWLAGLSLVNVLVVYFHATFHFLFGLGITDAVGIGINIVILAMFCAFGYFARNGSKPAFIVGMLLYLLDAGICIIGTAYLAAAVHAYVLYRLFTGFQAAQQYGKLAASENASAFDRSNQPPPPGVWPPPPNN
jgi:hypothetical protein